jgi:ABC-type nitrate/sulfonate/bicarbonate transport system substrate-binding protein
MRSTLLGVLAASCMLLCASVSAQAPLIRIAHGISNEEPLWLMAIRPDLTPNQGKRYALKLAPITTPTERFQAFLAGELEGGTAPAFTVLMARAQGMDIKLLAAIAQEGKGPDWFSTTLMVKDASPIQRAAELKGKTVGVLGFRTSPDLAVRAYVLGAGLIPDVDVKVVPIAFPAMGTAVRSDKVDVGAFVEPFYSAERAKGGLRPLVSAAEAVGYDHDVLNIWMGSRFIQQQPDAVRAFIADYSAALKYYLANRESAKREIHRANFVRTPLDTYLSLKEYKRDPEGRIDLASLKRLAVFMHDRLKWLERPVDPEEIMDPLSLR